MAECSQTAERSAVLEKIEQPGAAGIALALLAAATSIEPPWDRMLRASLSSGYFVAKQ
jgi:hypothetical protein